MIRWCAFHEIWCATNGRMEGQMNGRADERKKWHIEVGAPPENSISNIQNPIFSVHKETQSGNHGNRLGCHTQRHGKKWRALLLKIIVVKSGVITAKDKTKAMSSPSSFSLAIRKQLQWQTTLLNCCYRWCRYTQIQN